MKHNNLLGISGEGFHNVAYTEWGNWSRELASIICVHGLTRNSHDFDELSVYLSNKGRYILCPDIVGRGESDWFHDPKHYNFPQYMNDMSSLIARTNSKYIDWVGTSMGGIIGMMLAALPNTPIRRLVLNDIGPQVPLTGLRRLAKYAGTVPVFKSPDEAKAYFKIHYADFGDLSEQQWDVFTYHSIKHQAPNVYTIKVDPGIRSSKSPLQLANDFLHHPHKSLEGIFYDVDLWSIWKKIRCPVLVIHGKKSDLLTPEIIKEMRRTHPYIEVYEVANAGHAPALLEPKDHEIIYNWLMLNY